jgi:hypothetical protein
MVQAWIIKIIGLTGLSIAETIDRACLLTADEALVSNAALLNKLNPNDHHLGEKQSALMFTNFGQCNLLTSMVRDDGYVNWNTVVDSGPRRTLSSHRFLMELEIGAENMVLTNLDGELVGAEVEHICKHRNCADRTHLALVTHVENQFMRRLDFCYRGHDLRNGGRYESTGKCIECTRIRNAESSKMKAACDYFGF